MIPENWRYSRGDIYYANMDPNVGSEQGGERPVVVLQNDAGNKHSPTLIIATLTSRVDKKRHLPTHVLLDHNPGLKVPSIVQLEQIFTIDKRRVQRFAGQASSEEMDRIEAALKIKDQPGDELRGGMQRKCLESLFPFGWMDMKSWPPLRIHQIEPSPIT